MMRTLEAPVPPLLIEELKLRVPGLTPDEAQLLAQAVASQLGRRLPAHIPRRQVTELAVTLTVPVGTSQDSLPGLIVDAVLEKLA